MAEELVELTANWQIAAGLAYFGGHSIANDGNIVGLGSHCHILAWIVAIVVSERPPLLWVACLSSGKL